MFLLPLLIACDADLVELGTESDAPPTALGEMPERIETLPFPNGIAADEDHIYVVIGEPHSGPDSLPIGAGTTSVVQVFSTVDGGLVTEIEVAGGGHAMVMSADGSKLYVAHFTLDNQVTVISTETLEVVTEIGGLLQAKIVVPDSLSLSADGRWVYVGSNGPRTGWVARIDTTTDRVDSDFAVDVEGGFTCWVQASPDPDVVYANSWTGGTVQRKDVSSQQTTATVSVGAFPHALAVEPSGAFVYAMVSGGNTVLKLDGETLETVTEVEGPWAGLWGGPVTGTVSHDGRLLYVANHALGRIATVDIDPASATIDTVVETFEVGIDPIFSTQSPDGSRLYVANNGGSSISVITTR